MQQNDLYQSIWNPLIDLILATHRLVPIVGGANHRRVAHNLRNTGDALVRHVRRIKTSPRIQGSISPILFQMPRHFLAEFDRHLHIARGLGLLDLPSFTRLRGKSLKISIALNSLRAKTGPVLIPQMRKPLPVLPNRPKGSKAGISPLGVPTSRIVNAY